LKQGPEKVILDPREKKDKGGSKIDHKKGERVKKKPGEGGSK